MAASLPAGVAKILAMQSSNENVFFLAAIFTAIEYSLDAQFDKITG